jgi:hypothetical protein
LLEDECLLVPGYGDYLFACHREHVLGTVLRQRVIKTNSLTLTITRVTGINLNNYKSNMILRAVTAQLV